MYDSVYGIVYAVHVDTVYGIVYGPAMGSWEQARSRAKTRLVQAHREEYRRLLAQEQGVAEEGQTAGEARPSAGHGPVPGAPPPSRPYETPSPLDCPHPRSKVVPSQAGGFLVCGLCGEEVSYD